MSTRENIRLIARAPLCFHSVYKIVPTVLYLIAMFFYATTLQLHSRIFHRFCHLLMYTHGKS